MPSSLVNSFNLTRPGTHCGSTGRAFETGERFVTVLAERDDSEDFERIDYGLDAWNEGVRPDPPLRVFGVWQSDYAAPEERKGQFVEDDQLLTLFEQLAESDAARQRAFRYILALILIRRRLLVYEGAAEDGMRVRPTRAGARALGIPEEDRPVYDVIDPGLDDETLAEATEQVGLIMQGDS